MKPTSKSEIVENAFKHIVDFRNSSAPKALRPTATTQELRSLLGVGFGDTGRDPIDVIDSLVKAVEPGLMRNTDSNFYGWVMGASCEVGIAADMLTSAWGQNAGIYQTAPSAAIAEEVAANWLLDILDLPRESSVGFTTGATMASFISLAAARYEVLRRFDWDLEQDGMIGAPNVNIFLGAEAHASVTAVLRYLGFGDRNLVRVPADSQGRIRIDALARLMRGLTGPAIVVAQAGHINSGAFDAFNDLADLSERHNAWLHVDGAFGLWARGSRRYRNLGYGLERADSWAVDGHKWLQVPYDSGYAIVRDSNAHRQAMSISASYLNRDESDGRDPSEYGPELSRRARGFTTWAILQTLGRSGVESMVDKHCAGARTLANALKNFPGIRVLNDVVLNQVAVTFDDNYLNRSFTSRATVSKQHQLPRNTLSTDAVINQIQKSNRCFVSGADWRGFRIMRVSIISELTGCEEIDKLVSEIKGAWERVCGRQICDGQISQVDRIQAVTHR